jgi:hypothetical protein
LTAASGIRAVASSARCNVGVGHSIFEDFLSRGHELLWSAPDRRGIETPEIRGKSRYHRRAQGMRHVEHDIICPPMLDEGPQLVFQIFGLLPGEPWNGKKSAISLCRRPVTVFAVAYFGLNVSSRTHTRVIRAANAGENSGQDCRRQCQLQTDAPYYPAPASDVASRRLGMPKTHVHRFLAGVESFEGAQAVTPNN